MIKINMGCGKRNFGKDWLHIDKGDYDHLSHNDIFNFPYKDVDLIYASHLIEYFDDSEVKSLLDYWFLKLKVGGILRLAVPNFESISKLYTNGMNLDFFIGLLYGKMDMAGTKIYHRTVYDYKKLHKTLSNSGFSNISLWDHKQVDHGKYDDHSQAYIPHMDKDKGTLMSLNVQCSKE